VSLSSPSRSKAIGSENKIWENVPAPPESDRRESKAPILCEVDIGSVEEAIRSMYAIIHIMRVAEDEGGTKGPL